MGSKQKIFNFVRIENHETQIQARVSQGKTLTGPGFTAYILNMTSQQWLTYDQVSRSIWWHYLVVVVPDEIKHPNVAGVWVTGGHNTDGYPELKSEDMELTVTLALSTKVCW